MNSVVTAKQRVNVLVVDDDGPDRDSVYTAFFRKYSEHKDSLYHVNLLLPKTPTEAIRRLLAREPSFVVLDMRLNEEWGAQAEGIYEAIRRLECPIALLSMDFNDQAVSTRASKVLSDLRAIPKLGFLPYQSSIKRHCVNPHNGSDVADSLPDDPVNIWNLMLAEAQGHGRHWKPGIDGEVEFLHLTDTHFGQVRPDYLNAVAISAGARKNLKLYGDELKADYLLWTGDITDGGLPSQFQLALKFTSDLRRATILPEACPISITPGNHDLCWPLALSSRMQLVEVVHEASTVGTREKKVKRWNVEDVAVQRELATYGGQPFREFVSNLVSEPAPVLSHGYRWQTQWSHLGFAILEMPIEAHVVPTRSDQANPEPLLTEEEFVVITDNAIAAVRDSQLPPALCVIVLIHGRSPTQESVYAARWESLVTRVLELGNPVIVLGGHEHLNDHQPRKRQLTIIGAPLSEKKTEGGLTLPSIGFIRLSGLSTTSLVCKVTKLQKRAGDGGVPEWIPEAPRRFELSPRSGNWEDVSNCPSTL